MNYKNKSSRVKILMAEKPKTADPSVSNLYPCFTVILLICVITQKKLSLAWETTLEPAPIATTVIALSMGASKPREGIKGTIIDAVVIMATVEDP